MALSATQNNTGLGAVCMRRWDVIKQSNANKGSLVFAHKLAPGGVATIPRKISFEPLLSQAWASAWCVKQASLTATTLVLTCTSVTASGATTAQVAVYVEAPWAGGQ